MLHCFQPNEMKKISPPGRLRLKKIIRLLLGKLGIALLADFDLSPVDFSLVKALDRSPLANRTFRSTIVELVSDSRSPMCFGHSILLIEIGFLETISNSLSARQGIELIRLSKKTGASAPACSIDFPFLSICSGILASAFGRNILCFSINSFLMGIMPMAMRNRF